MISLNDIRYVRLGTADLDAAVRYATEILGLQLARREGKSAYLRADDRDHTLVYTQGNPGDHVAAFDVRTAAELEAAAAELDRAGREVRAGTRSECEQRAVDAFIAFKDPSGNCDRDGESAGAQRAALFPVARRRHHGLLAHRPALGLAAQG